MVKNTYLLLSILGFILPNYFLYQIIVDQNGFNLSRFITDISLNYSSKFILADLGIAATTFLIFLYFENRKIKLNLWWLPVLGTFLVGVSFGFPLFMYLRQIELENTKKLTV